MIESLYTMKSKAQVCLKAPPKEISFTNPKFSLLIRPLEGRDAACVHEAVISSHEALLSFMSWAHQELSKEGQKARLCEARKNYDAGLEYELGVFDRNTGEFIMAASWTPSQRLNRKALEIGYWTHSNHCNKGLATYVTRILIVVAFDVMKSDRVEICCNVKNMASLRVIEKCDFKLEGEIRNYFEEPTEEMLRNNYFSERSCLRYALIPEDKPSLPWYHEIANSISVSPLSP